MTDKLELKSNHEAVHTVYVADVESIFYCKPDDPDILTVLMKDGKRLYCDEVCPVDSLQEEPVSEDLEKAAVNAFKQIIDSDKNNFLEIFKAGAEWKKQKTVDKACKWIEKRAARYLVDRFVDGMRITGIDTSITDDFRKDMED